LTPKYGHIDDDILLGVLTKENIVVLRTILRSNCLERRVNTLPICTAMLIPQNCLELTSGEQQGYIKLQPPRRIQLKRADNTWCRSDGKISMAFAKELEGPF